MSEQKIKLFVAIPVPAHLKENLIQFISFNQNVTNIRWVPQENWHVTLFFIGFIQKEKLEAVNKIISETISRFNSFDLHFSHYSLEGKPSKATMIWYRFNYSETFETISQEINNGLKNQLEQVQDFKRKIPHITLARLRRSVKRKQIKLDIMPDVVTLKAVQCELWQSIGTTSGMIYKSLYTYKFN